MIVGASVALEVLGQHQIVHSQTYEILVDLVSEALKRLQKLDDTLLSPGTPEG